MYICIHIWKGLDTYLNMYVRSYIISSLVRFYCIVDGGWSDWEHGPCTKTCGGGKMSMIRKCNNPEPSCGGNECTGSNVFPLETPCNGFCCLGKIMTPCIFCIRLYTY